ncbi:MAG: ABC transporter permease [Acidobacteriaceae bacterium]|nr:ABC transporter permease [Acidobacteriaceae bacterium]
MPAERKSPFALALCHAIVRAAAQLLPVAEQQEWKREWFGEVWHRCQLLRHTGSWNTREALRLVRDCLGAFADAGWHFARRGQVQTRLHEWARSPWMCLGVLAALLTAAGAMSHGFAAMRQLLPNARPNQASLVSIWLHPGVGGRDKLLPSDLPPRWAKQSRLLESATGFTVRHDSVYALGASPRRSLVVTSDPALFATFGTTPELGTVASHSVVLTHDVWISAFHRDARVVGRRIVIGNRIYRVSGVLPASFRFLSREPAVFITENDLKDALAMVVVRAKPGVSTQKLDRELTRIAEDCCYYFYDSELRLKPITSAAFTPVRFFGVAVLIGVLMLAAVSRLRLRGWQAAWSRQRRPATFRRIGFLAAKSGLAWAFVFLAGLEWSRPASSMLFASKDPASGPLLIWLYILGAMGVAFWSLADQRARCRVCLRLLCFPVRIGCPGCLLLDWSGTELLCTEGHGVLHVPTLAASWDDQPQQWIAMDESWQGLFAHHR